MTARPSTRTVLALLTVACVALAGCSKNTGSSGARHGGPAGGLPAHGGAPTPGGTYGYGQDGFPAEVDPSVNPKSTFAMDVDTASYGYARNLLNQGLRPQPQGIRPEEFVNAFREDYPQPDGNGFTVTLDGTRLPTTHHPRSDGDIRLLRVGLQTRAGDRIERPDAALTLVIDVSGSMGDPGKLDMVKQALHTLVDQLRP